MNTLEALERANLFVIALDDRRRWYRYHHLFADVLRAGLLAAQPHLIPTLHRRASAWFEQEGDHAAAIDHALAADESPGPLTSSSWQPATCSREGRT